MPDRSVRISDDVWRRAKAAAALREEPLSTFVDAAIEARLRGVVQVDARVLETGAKQVEPVEWPTADGVVVVAKAPGPLF